ncbi:hypothetical protein [Streptomyces sp. NPDC059460]|uniref:hypothetical protein n=1 Tax=Streptomyces sp. NPDC059460 TaxID=3346840 RepID=UPI00369D42A3
MVLHPLEGESADRQSGAQRQMERAGVQHPRQFGLDVLHDVPPVNVHDTGDGTAPGGVGRQFAGGGPFTHPHHRSHRDVPPH